MSMQDLTQNFEQLNEMQIPVKRAAFSDRTAWIMAILAELAYAEFDEEKEQFFPKLAAELAALTNQKKIEERLRELRDKLADLSKTPAGPKTKNKALKATLKAGGFVLAAQATRNTAALHWWTRSMASGPSVAGSAYCRFAFRISTSASLSFSLKSRMTIRTSCI